MLEQNNPSRVFSNYDNDDIQSFLKELKVPWSSVGYIVYKRTYARRKGGTRSASSPNETENWLETVQRVVDACRVQLGMSTTEVFSDDDYLSLAKYIYTLKCSVAGRFLWQLGAETVNRLGLASLQNCAFVPVNSPCAFTWAFDMLMLGCGVGFSVASRDVGKLPRISQNFVPPKRVDGASADFIVPDTREGWVKLLEHVLGTAFEPQAYYEYGYRSSSFTNIGTLKPGFTYSTSLVRSKGSIINGFGGVASGPNVLVDGIQKISNILYSRRGSYLRPIDCYDIMCIIGSIVVAGNVRRSALIAIGDSNDSDYLTAKRWSYGNIPSWRAMANNSVYCDHIDQLGDLFWQTYFDGEPYGLINIELARSHGRTADKAETIVERRVDYGVDSSDNKSSSTHKYYIEPDNAQGFNPCAEQPLAPYETCCLAEVYLPNVESKRELLDILRLLYAVCKHSLVVLPAHHYETDAIVKRNLRMGIGVTGYLQATDEQRSWLPSAYVYLRKIDSIYSNVLGVPQSIRLTTVKPSGTLSLLPGVTPGCHPAYGHHVIRRIRFSADDPIVGLCRKLGYPVEYQVNFDGSADHSTVVIEFPMKYSSNSKKASEMSAIDQLKVIKKLQNDWSDNAVSCTIYFKKEERDIEEIKNYLRKNYTNSFKSLSFLPFVDHGFKQAPLEEISEEEYERRVSSVVLIDQDVFERELGDRGSRHELGNFTDRQMSTHADESAQPGGQGEFGEEPKKNFEISTGDDCEASGSCPIK